MITRIVSLFIILLFSSPKLVLPANIAINSPQNGDVLQGTVEITGTVLSDSFSYAEIFYGYSDSKPENWFLISKTGEQVKNGVLARWDTTTITDGEYRLKLVLTKNDGSKEELIVSPIYVRNYSVKPTETSAPFNDASVKIETGTPTSINSSFATPLPENPASISEMGIKRSMIIGILISIFLVSGLVLYQILINRRR
jgi:hypothetical protein